MLRTSADDSHRNIRKRVTQIESRSTSCDPALAMTIATLGRSVTSQKRVPMEAMAKHSGLEEESMHQNWSKTDCSSPKHRQLPHPSSLRLYWTEVVC